MRLIVVAWLSLTLVTTGCALSDSSESVDSTTVPVEPTVTREYADWLLHSDGPPGTTMAALFTGEIHIDMVGRCVTLRDDSNRETVVVFVDGAILDVTDPDAPLLILHNGDSYADGDSIELGGGSWGVQPDFAYMTPDSAYHRIEIPPACEHLPVWIAAYQ